MNDVAAEHDEFELSIVMPCLNEERTLAACISEAKAFLRDHRVSGEVLIADNGSSDRSREIALSAGAKVVEVAERGYGSAIQGGMNAAKGRFIVVGDADQSYDFSRLQPYLDALRAGADLVIGNRFQGGIESGAMPALHRLLGNPVLSFLGRLFFRIKIGDFHCGLRAVRRAALEKLSLKTAGMEFASEMIVKAALAKLRIVEVPTVLRRDGRDRRPHLRTWRDGWRHLRFLLLYSPRWLFLIPGLTSVALGAGGLIALLPGPLKVFGVELDVHTMLYMGALILVGVQSLVFGLSSKLFAMRNGLLPLDTRFERTASKLAIEWGLVVGGLFALAGVGLTAFAIISWGQNSFGGLLPAEMMRITIPGVLFFLLGLQLMLASFFLGVLNLQYAGAENS